MDGGGSVKKPRGRPRKYGPMLDPNSPTPQRKRGRPRKQLLVDVETTAIGNAELPLSVHTVVSDDDLLSEILVRLPVISLVLFKSVSKRWLSLIKDAAFIKRRSRIPIIDPPSGLFIKPDHLFKEYGFASLDIRIQRPRLENTFETEYGDATVLQSCNGLFLCRVKTLDRKYYVYNPTINKFKMLPQPELQHWDFTRMDFDPTKSPHYKVVHATFIGHVNRFLIQTYSSETGIWSIVCSCTDPLPVPIPHNDDFRNGIFLNDAIHWIHYDCERRLHYKLDFVTKTVVLTQIQLPVTMDFHCKLFESRGCLLLLGMDKTHPEDQLNIYVMRNGHPGWTFKHCVNHSSINPFEHSSISPFEVLCIDLGEREEDSFMVIDVNKEVFLYKFVLKTFRKLPELESMFSKIRYFPVRSFLFTASFASV